MARGTARHQELDVEELLLELELLRVFTDGAAATEAGGDSVRQAAGAPGRLPMAPRARASSIRTNTAIKRVNPTLQRDELDVNFFEILRGWGRSMMLTLSSRRAVGSSKDWPVERTDELNKEREVRYPSHMTRKQLCLQSSARRKHREMTYQNPSPS